MPQKPKLGERELDIMNALWDAGAATVGEVHGALTEKGADVAYTTVQTMLNRLETKGHVARERSGRAFVYRPRLRRPAAAGRAVRGVIERFFGGSAEALAKHLVEGDLDPKELARVRRLIDDVRKEKSR